MDFEIPTELADYLKQLDDFIEREIKPLEQADDNIRFFDHRRENERTDWDREGLPNQDWEELLAEARRTQPRWSSRRCAMSGRIASALECRHGRGLVAEPCTLAGLVRPTE